MADVLKHIYFVRHGESTGNSERLYQTLTEPLTERGRQQARCAGEALCNTAFETILVSDTTRTCDTVEQMRSYLPDVPVERHEVLREIKRPSEFHGESVDEPWTLEAKKQIKENSDDPDWHYSDEENVYDQIARGKEALAMLEERPEETLLVVTHGTFLRIMMGLMLHGDLFSPQMVRNYNMRFKTWNAAISYAQQVATDDRGAEWQVVSWNACSHLMAN